MQPLDAVSLLLILVQLYNKAADQQSKCSHYNSTENTYQSADIFAIHLLSVSFLFYLGEEMGNR